MELCIFDAVATIAWGPVCALTLLITAGVALDATLVITMMRNLRSVSLSTRD